MRQVTLRTIRILAATVIGSCLLASQAPKLGIPDIYTKVTRQTGAQATGSSKVRQNLVWLLAYPFAGSNAVLRIVHEVSGKSCATNYGEAVWTNWDDYVVKQFDSVPAYSGAPNGPFKVHFQLELPDEELLTKTACGGFCMDEGNDQCTLEDYVVPLLKTHTFLQACASGTTYRVVGDILEYVSYDSYRVKKGVVLLRDPVEILVSRFSDRAKNEGTYPINRPGLHSYCSIYDNRNSTKHLAEGWYTDEQRQHAAYIPCHEEFFRIVMWYNQAFKLLEETGKEELILHFNSFGTTHKEEAVDKLFDFLHLDKIDGYKIPFERAETDFYSRSNWFNDDELYRIKAFIEATASPKTRLQLHRYFRTVKYPN